MMVSASKILTVSYGTFSCTLEGFEEPFSTMKAIAEYFRDLAADDRYFGAEPPTPDAEMLHRIAEREIQRRVEAKIQTNSVVLRASDASDRLAPAHRDSAPAIQPDATYAAPRRPPAAAPVATPMTSGIDEDLDQDAPAARVAAPSDTFPQDSVAAKLLRIRAAVAQGAAPVAAPAADAAAEAARVEAERLAAEEQAEAARVEAERLAAEEQAEAARIEAERLAAEEQAEAARVEAERLAAEEQAEAARVEAERLAAEEQAEAARIEAERLAAEEQAEAARVEAERLAAEEQAEAARIEAERLAAEEQAEAARVEAERLAAEEQAEDDLDTALRARVLKISQTSPLSMAIDDDADADDEAPETADTTSGDDPLAGSIAKVSQWVGETSLSEQDEADLLKELAEVDLESKSLRADNEDEDEGGAVPGLDRLTQGTETEEAAMSRLMKQANTELAEPESRRRHSAIEHLRAAVAATRADRHAPEAAAQAATQNRMDRFRDDLATAVQPRRPVAGSGDRPTPRRPSLDAGRIAPLVLVSEQRIDANVSPRTVQPVRPRRINTGNLALDDSRDDEVLEQDDTRNILASDTGFADFAARIGATELADLLEAAAVYCAHIEGRESFSRPQVLRKLNELPDHGEISREDGLRSFGKLLREGRITKVRRGQFSVMEGSRYLPEARRIAQG
jgi:hypothetical protein